MQGTVRVLTMEMVVTGMEAGGAVGRGVAAGMGTNVMVLGT